MEQTKKSTFKLLFYLKKNELKKNGNAPIMARITRHWQKWIIHYCPKRLRIKK